MSEINDLIHTQAVIAYNQGVARERERIIELLEAPIRQESKLLDFNPNRTDFKFHHAKITIAKQFIELIRGEHK